MKNQLFLPVFLFGLLSHSIGQVTCIQCFNQNEPLNPQAANRILNGSFENTNCMPGWLAGSFSPNSDLYNCDLEDWQCTGGGSASYPIIFDSTLCVIPDGQYAAYFGNGNAFACVDFSFDTSCLVRDGCTIGGFPSGLPASLDGYGREIGISIEQFVHELTIGETYILEFWAGGEALDGLLTSPGVFAIDVGFGKTFLTSEPTDEDHNSTGTVFMVEFIANSTDHMITFTNWGHMCIDCTELVIDNVRLYPLSEAEFTCVTSTAGIEEKDEFTIYPNPSNDVIHFEGMYNADYSFSILSLDGRLIMKPVNNRNSIDVSSLPKGVYLLFIEGEGQRVVRKIVKS